MKYKGRKMKPHRVRELKKQQERLRKWTKHNVIDWKEIEKLYGLS